MRERENVLKLKKKKNYNKIVNFKTQIEIHKYTKTPNTNMEIRWQNKYCFDVKGWGCNWEN